MCFRRFKQISVRGVRRLKQFGGFKAQQARKDIQRGAGLAPDSGHGKIQVPSWDDIPQDIRNEAAGNKVKAIKLLRERGQKIRNSDHE